MRHIILTSWLLLCCALIMPISGSSQDEAIVVFVHPDVPADSLNADELRSVFRTETRYWDDGQTVIALNLPPEHPLRQTFDRAVLGFDPDQMVKFWVDRTVRGGARAPRTVPSPSLIARVVVKLPGAIGYTSASTAPADAKVVATVVGGRVAWSTGHRRVAAIPRKGALARFLDALGGDLGGRGKS